MTRIRIVAWAMWLQMLRKKDIYVLLILLVALLSSLLSVDVFGMEGASGYAQDLGLAFAWLFSIVIAVTTAGRELPTEERQGTIYSLLAKPIRRFELVAGKWVGAWTIASAATLCFYCLILAGIFAAGGVFKAGLFSQGFLLHSGALAIVCALAVALSTRMNFDAAATSSFVLTGGIFLLLPRVPELMALETGFRRVGLACVYYALPHLELFDMRQRLVHEAALARWDIVAGILLYGVVATSGLLALAWLGYRRKMFQRGIAT